MLCIPGHLRFDRLDYVRGVYSGRLVNGSQPRRCLNEAVVNVYVNTAVPDIVDYMNSIIDQ